MHVSARILFRLLGASLILLLCGLALVAVRLHAGPLDLAPLVPWIERTISGQVAPHGLRIGRAELRWGGADRPLRLDLSSVTVLDADQVEILSIQNAWVTLAGSAVLAGQSAIAEIGVIAPRFEASRTTNGAWVLADGPAGGLLEVMVADALEQDADAPSVQPTDSQSVAVPSDWSDVPDRIRETLLSYGGRHLRQVEVVDATVSVIDHRSGVHWRGEEISTVLSPLGVDGLSFELSGRLSGTPLLTDGSTPPLQADNLDPNPDQISLAQVDLVLRLPHTADREPVEFALGLGAMNPQQVLALVEPALAAEGISVPMQDLPRVDLPLDATITGALDVSRIGTDRRAPLAGLRPVVVSLSGHSAAERPEDHGLGMISLPNPLGRAYRLFGFDATLTSTAGLGKIELDHIKLDLQDVLVTGSAVVDHPFGAPRLTAQIGLTDLHVEDLKRYWPRGVAHGAWKWISQNLSAGVARQGDVSVALAGPSWEHLDLTDLEGRILVDGMTVDYRNPLPPVHGVNGEVILGPEAVVIEAFSGVIGDISTRSGTIVFDNFGGIEQADIQLSLDAPLSEALWVIDHEPLNYAAAIGVDPAVVSGQAEVSLGFQFPLLADLTFDDVSVAVSASLVEGQIPDVLFGNNLTDGVFDLTLDESGMDVEGRASIGGVSADVVWREDFTDDVIIRRRYQVKTALGNDVRGQFLLTAEPFHPPYLDGSVPGTLVYTERTDGIDLLEADLDLTGVSFGLEPLGWMKAAGVPGSGRVDAEFRPDGADIRFSVRQDGSGLGSAVPLSATGTVRLAGPDLDFAVLEMTDVRYGDNRLAGTMRVEQHRPMGLVQSRPAEDRLAITITEGIFDARPFLSLEEMTDGDAFTSNLPDPAENSIPDIAVAYALDQVYLTDGIILSDATGDLQFAGGDADGLLASVNVGGTLVGGDPLHFLLSPTGEGLQRRFSLSTGNGGAVITALIGKERIRGGRMTLTGELAEGGTAVGQLELSGFRLVDAPLTAQLLSVAGLTGILDVLGGTGISFSRAEVPFTRQDQEFGFTDARAWGDAIGLRATGSYNLGTDHVSLSGSLAPANAVNRVLGAIPLLGPIITGAQGDGVIALSFAMDGPASDPDVAVNPLSAITPGLLRDLFGGLTDAQPSDLENTGRVGPLDDTNNSGPD